MFKVRYTVENPSDTQGRNEMVTSLSCAVLKFSEGTKVQVLQLKSLQPKFVLIPAHLNVLFPFYFCFVSTF